MRDPAKKPVSFIYALRGPLHSIIFFFLLINALFGLARENSRHLATPLLVSPPNDVWETSAKSPWLMTRHYPDLGRASDRSCRVGNLIQPIRSRNQIWIMTRHQYGISALVSQTSFGEKPVIASPNVGCFLRLYPAIQMLVPLHLPLLGFCFFFFCVWVCVCCITNLYCISLEEHPIKLWKKLP